MNFLKKLLDEGSRVIQETVTEENKEKAVSFLNQLKDAADDLIDQAKELKENTLKESEVQEPAAFEEEQPEDVRTAREKILQILAEDFPAYTVREDVSPREFGGTGRFMNYSIAVFSSDTPVLFMMLVGKTTCSHREYRWSKEEAEKLSVPMINFINHYPNRPEYIRNRLQKYL